MDKSFTNQLHVAEKVRSLYARFNDFCSHNYERVRADIEAYENAAAEARLKYAGLRLLIAFYPLILTERQAAYIGGVAEATLRLMEKITALFLHEPAVRNAFNFGPQQLDLIETHPGYDLSIPCSRLDSYFDGHGLRFSEINTDGAAGMDGAHKLPRLFLASPTMREFFSAFPNITVFDINHGVLHALLRCYREFAGGSGTATPRIAIVDWKEVRTYEEFLAYEEFFKEHGYDALVADPRELEYNGRALSHRGRKIDIIYRRVVSTEYVERLDEVKPMTRAFKDHNVCVVGSFRSDVAFNKKVFAVPHDPRLSRFFTEEERMLAERHIPWTRAFEDIECEYRGERMSMRELARVHKDRFVLKPSNLYEGRGVKLGKVTSQEDWEHHIGEALETDYVLQELIPIPTMPVGIWQDGMEVSPWFIHVGEYVFGGRFCGLYCRAADVPVIDRLSKERMLPCLVLKE
ncbi:MAG: hypothetical protein Kow0099_10190 [Candidatus Abyssubacteria bacterium]